MKDYLMSDDELDGLCEIPTPFYDGMAWISEFDTINNAKIGDIVTHHGKPIGTLIHSGDNSGYCKVKLHV